MTRSPRTIARTELAAAALAVMERHAITQLLIVDDAGRPDGLLHLHDLLKATVA
jgi:arabinose-5-phosphate isomerase